MAKRETFSSEPVYTIGIAARKLGVSVHALRLYEREGLIVPFRTETNRRVYSDIEVRKIEGIKEMIRRFGLNFEGLRRLMALVPCYRMCKGCTKEGRATCAHHQQTDRPCWACETPCKAEGNANACRECPVYTSVLGYSDIQRLIVG